MTQRQILAAARAFAPYWTNHALMLSQTAEFARAEGVLLLIFEQCPRERIFTTHIKHNLSRAGWKALEARYAEWERQTRLEVTG